jgi:hypothetical protein
MGLFNDHPSIDINVARQLPGIRRTLLLAPVEACVLV